MVISSSTVGMSSKRNYVYYEQTETASLTEKAGQAVSLEVSAEGKSLMKQLKEYQADQKAQQEQTSAENLQKLLELNKTNQSNNQFMPNTDNIYQGKLEMLLQLLRALNGSKGGSHLYNTDWMKQTSGNFFGTTSQLSLGIFGATSVSASASASTSTSTASHNTNVWTRTTVTSGFVSEAEFTAFETVGTAKTTDGREINFGVTVEMSRAFCEKYESFTQQDYVSTDPLVINLDSNTASVSDMKFLFDLDSDGDKEEISFTENGSGFLALDKNGDGAINDGSELFGTKSGDGFADLAAYDEDGNGWIDEADSVFKDLKVWMKDEDGKDVLLDLKQADVGAIYLGNADTEFSLKNQETQATNAVIRKTGIFLKESGGVGTVQHVDLAV